MRVCSGSAAAMRALEQEVWCENAGAKMLVQRSAGEGLLVEGFLVKQLLVDQKLKRYAFNCESVATI
jgi:hypothetical protein